MIKRIKREIKDFGPSFKKLKLIEQVFVCSILFISVFSIFTVYDYPRKAEAIFCVSPAACTVTGAVFGGASGNGTIASPVVPNIDANGNYIASLLLTPDAGYEAKSVSTTANCSASIVGGYAVTSMLTTPGCKVTVNFALIYVPPAPTTNYSVSVSTTGGTGSGSVRSSPAGINCPGTCSANFAKGSTVGFTAFPSTGSSLGNNNCGSSIFMDGNYNCSFDFDAAKADPVVTVSANPMTVTSSNPSTISWNVTNSTLCSGSWINNKIPAESGTFSVASFPTGQYNSNDLYYTTTFTVSCSN